MGAPWPVGVYVLLCRNVVKGRESECGMCPDERPGRGSGSFPVNLSNIDMSISDTGNSTDHSYLPFGRASRMSSADSFDGSSAQLLTICS